MDIEQIKARIEALKRERERVAMELQMRAAAIGGGIAELEKLLATEEKEQLTTESTENTEKIIEGEEQEQHTTKDAKG